MNFVLSLFKGFQTSKWQNQRSLRKLSVDLKLLNLTSPNRTLCRNITRISSSNYLINNEHGTFWHRHYSGQAEILVYSAFYDNRKAGGNLPWIRILTLSTRIKDLPYCYVWYSGIKHPLILRTTRHNSGRGDDLFGTFYKQLLLSCKLPSNSTIPTHVSVVPSLCDSPSMLVPIIISQKSQPQVEFGICVTASFGKMDQYEMVEWFEFSNLLGVGEFNIYNTSIKPGIEDVFKYYSDKGMLKLRQMPPVKPDYTFKGGYLNSPASYNDCMLRNMYRYRYIVVIDFDEIIIPNKQCNYTELLRKINANKKLHKPWRSYTFRNTYHFLENRPDQLQPKYLRSLHYRKRNKPNGYMYAPKSFIDPRTCLSVFNHYCWIRFPNLPGDFTIDVPTDIAISHHFRNCNHGNENCQKYRNDSFNDDIIVQYKEQLDKRVRKVLEMLKLPI